MTSSVLYYTCAILLYVTFVTSESNVKHVYIKGDFILGALFPIHTLGGDGTCGSKIDDQNGIQNLEAMLYSSKMANNIILKSIGIKIGVLAYDSCRSETVALERAMEFVKLQTHILGIDSMFVCKNGSKPTLRDDKRLIGVVGAATSNVCMQLASFLRLFKIPQISYGATSPELSDTTRFDYFMRTVPSDNYQSEAIVAILDKFDWKYIVGIHEDTSYGENGFEQVKLHAEAGGICIGKTFRIKGYFQNEVSQRAELSNILKEALRFNNTAGKVIVVLYMMDDLANMIFEEASELEGGDKFIWVGSDGWTGRKVNSKGRKIANNSLGVQPKIRVIPQFDEYFENLQLNSHSVNPWFPDYWAQQFNCTNSKTLASKVKLSQCTGNEKLVEGMYEKNKNTYAVMDAVYAFAHALKALHKYKCKDKMSVCEEMKNTQAADIKRYLVDKNFSFTDSANLTFKFINNSGPVRYSLMRYIDTGDDSTWVEIDQFVLKELPRASSKDKYFPKLSTSTLPYKQSICSAPCKQGEAKLYTNIGIKCCWTCDPCKQHQYLLKYNLSCVDCPEGYLSNGTKTGCLPIKETTMDLQNTWAILSLTLTCVGFVVTCIVAGIFYWQRETPLIMASGKELSFVLLFGIQMSYLSSFAFVSYPTPVSCGFTRVMLGLSYTICYASILVKTNRIYRVFNINTSKPKKVKFISAKSQLLITFAIVGVEIIALFVWLLLEPAEHAFLYPNRLQKIRVCEDAMDYAYLGALAYPFLLMILCVYYAIRTRKTPDGFNETRYITFGSYSFCVLWIAFTSIYFSVGNNTIRVVALCFASFINATVTLITLFITKTYVVIFRPQKNTRENVMARRRTHSYDTVNINSTSNLSRLPSAISTWHSVHPQVFDSEDSVPQTITISQKPKFGNKLSVSVLSMNNVDHLDGSVASNLNVLSMPNSNGANPDQDIVVIAAPVKKKDLGDERLKQFLDSNEHHHDSDVNNGFGQSVPRRSLRSFKSRRKRRRTVKRTRSLDGVNAPNIVVTPSTEETGIVVHL